jgi:3-oxoacyl-[acyl-carrier-protein] synthase-3
VTFTEILQFIPGTTITTDGACAILLSKSGIRNKLINIEVDIYGEYAGGIWNGEEAQYSFENNYSQYLSTVIEKCARNASILLENIKLIMPHNVNTLSWSKVMKMLQLPADKIFLKNIPETGHCFGSDPFLNFQRAQELNLIEKEDYIILATVGLGATFAAMIIKS